MLRTPAPLIGALGLSLKRAFALLAESTLGSRCNGCSLFSLMLEGRRRRRGRAVITACMFCLAQWLNQSFACVSINNGRSEISGRFAPLAFWPGQECGSLSFLFPESLGL